ncbi:MAG: SCO1664 family protein, partial [Trebonia sp.]
MREKAAAWDSELPEAEREALELLERGALTVQGRLVDASNATLYATVESHGRRAHCVYKPVAGER